MRVLYISLIITLLDQATKLIVKGFSIPFLGIEVEGMYYGESISVIGEFFKITFVENPGMAFGIDVGDVSKFFLSLFSLVASIALIYYIFKVRNESLIFRVSLALILAGAVGNFIDRAFYGIFYDYAPLFYGKVVDFFNFDFWDFTIFGRTYNRWPIFNIADASVSTGVIMLLLFHKEAEPAAEGKSADKTDPETISEESSSPDDEIISNDLEKDVKTDNREGL